MTDFNIVEDYIHEFYLDLKTKLSKSGNILIVDEEKEKLKEINILTLLHYIKETTGILIQMKFEEKIKNYERELKIKILNEIENGVNRDKEKEKLSTPNSGSNINTNSKTYNNTLTELSPTHFLAQQEEYEKIICKLEADVRAHIKSEYQLKLHNEYLEAKLEDYEELQEELESMQKKIEKYEQKISLNEYSSVTDKKENEILILKAENKNLKTSIVGLEEKIKKLTENENKLMIIKNEYEKELVGNTEIIAKLNRKIKNYEKLKKSMDVGNGISTMNNFFNSSNNGNMRTNIRGINLQLSTSNLMNGIRKESTERKESNEEVDTDNNPHTKRCSSVIDKVKKINLNKSDYSKDNNIPQCNTYRKPANNENLLKSLNNEQIISTNGNHQSQKDLKNFTRIKIPLNLKRPEVTKNMNMITKNTISSPISNLKLKNPNSTTHTITGKLNRVSSTGSIKNIPQTNSSMSKSVTGVNFSSLRQYVHSQVPRNKMNQRQPNLSTLNMRSTSMSNH